jgi:hypothetical protein
VVRETPTVQFFGLTTGFIVNYTADHAVRFDLEGRPMETLARAYRPGEVTLHLGGRAIPPASVGHLLSIRATCCLEPAGRLFPETDFLEPPPWQKRLCISSCST